MRAEARDLDVIIIGAGPAGISAGIWCKDLGLNAIVLEKEPEPGGQLLSIYNPITNYPGLTAKNGREMRDRFMETAVNYGVEIILSAEVVELDSEKLSVTTANGKKYSARSIILATGVHRRKLNIPGEKEFQGKGIIESGSRDKELVRGKTVAIIGGGDAALENALILSEYASKIYLIHRRDSFNAREEFSEAVLRNPKIECIFGTRISQIRGVEKVESIEVTGRREDGNSQLDVDFILIRIGVELNNGLVEDTALLSENDYSRDCLTSSSAMIIPAGDVANPVSMTIVTAAGDGASAGKTIQHLLMGKKRL